MWLDAAEIRDSVVEVPGGGSAPTKCGLDGSTGWNGAGGGGRIRVDAASLQNVTYKLKLDPNENGSADQTVPIQVPNPGTWRANPGTNYLTTIVGHDFGSGAPATDQQLYAPTPITDFVKYLDPNGDVHVRIEAKGKHSVAQPGKLGVDGVELHYQKN